MDLATDIVYVSTTQFYNDNYYRASVFFIAIPLLIQVIIGPVHDKYMKLEKSSWQQFKEAVALTFGFAPYIHRNLDEDYLLHMNKTANAYYQDVP